MFVSPLNFTNKHSTETEKKFSRLCVHWKRNEKNVVECFLTFAKCFLLLFWVCISTCAPRACTRHTNSSSLFVIFCLLQCESVTHMQTQPQTFLENTFVGTRASKRLSELAKTCKNGSGQMRVVCVVWIYVSYATIRIVLHVRAILLLFWTELAVTEQSNQIQCSISFSTNFQRCWTIHNVKALRSFRLT